MYLLNIKNLKNSLQYKKNDCFSTEIQCFYNVKHTTNHWKNECLKCEKKTGYICLVTNVFYIGFWLNFAWYSYKLLLLFLSFIKENSFLFT